MSVYVLIHGAWHGAWCWEKIVPMLTRCGHEAIAVDLPAAAINLFDAEDGRALFHGLQEAGP